MSGKLYSRIHSLLPVDKFRLLKMAGRPNPGANLESEITAAEQRKKYRSQNLPKPELNESLPIFAKKDRIIAALKKERVCVITGETGSGKTTQLPLMCLLAGKGKNGKIGCTQPRRIAALTVADRLRQEIGRADAVGHAIRFDDSDSEDSYIKVMTDGILLAETQKDPWLNEYETIIIDEAHERSLNIDFLLGIIKTLLNKRDNLSLIITSATIDTAKFSKAFDNAPVIEVSGRMYPVQTIYAVQDEEEETSLAEKALKAFRTHCTVSAGDVLAFFPTEQDIREFCDSMAGFSDVHCLPLFARLPAAQQKSIFLPSDRRKVIAATNIAETSITVPGIRYVIDTGFARISSYSAHSRTTLLPVRKISKSSADQRKGRCGRTANGVCIRLYGEKDYKERELYTAPEIQRQNLAEVLLKMHSLKIHDPDSFPFIDKPKRRNISEGYRILTELGALRKSGNSWILTAQGRQMAHFPLDPKMSRILIEAARRGCLEQAAIVVSVLTIQDPRERPQGKEKEADLAHRRHMNADSDFLSLLGLWELFRQERDTVGLRRFCRENFLSFRRMKEWLDIREQIRRILAERRLVSSAKNSGDLNETLHKSILSGFIAHIACRKNRDIYTNAAGREVMIFPGSAVFGNGSEWIMSAEQVETSRLFARNVANITAGWIEEAGAALCRKTYTDIHWDEKANTVRARLKLGIFGMPLSADRTVNYGEINPEKACEVFIREALVAGRYTPDHQTAGIPFLDHNKREMEAIREMENRNRRRDLLIDNESLYRLYREQLPRIYSFSLLEQSVRRNMPDFLCFRQEELMLRPNETDAGLFPDFITAGNTQLDLTYEFLPDSGRDGLTIQVPLAESARLDALLPDWLVPGMLEEKVIHIMKGLPRQFRRRLVPLRENLELVMKRIVYAQGSFYGQLSEILYSEFRLDCPEEMLREISLPDWLRARIALVDGRKQEIRASRDKSILTEKKQEASKQLEQKKTGYEQADIQSWPDYDFIKTVIVANKHNISAEFHPGLAAEDNGINLRLFAGKEQRNLAHREGTVRLAMRELKDQIIMIIKTGPVASGPGKYLKKHYPETRLHESMVRETCRSLYPEKGIFTKADYADWLLFCRENLTEKYGETKAALEQTLLLCVELDAWLSGQLYASHAHKAVHDFLQDRINQLSGLGGNKKWLFFHPEELRTLQRFLKGLRIRSERGISSPFRDAEKNMPVAHVYRRTAEMHGERKREYLLMLYDLELSVFAPEVRGRRKISVKDLEEFA